MGRRKEDSCVLAVNGWGWGARTVIVGENRCTAGFFFQAEDGIRDRTVTGVQTCALPIYRNRKVSSRAAQHRARDQDASRLADFASQCAPSARIFPSKKRAPRREIPAAIK